MFKLKKSMKKRTGKTEVLPQYFLNLWPQKLISLRLRFQISKMNTDKYQNYGDKY